MKLIVSVSSEERIQPAKVLRLSHWPLREVDRLIADEAVTLRRVLY